jgi:hypothetical protein
MADVSITSANIRDAGGWTSDEVSDTTLTSSLVATSAAAWATTALGGTIYSDLSSTEQALVKAACIYYACHLVRVGPGRRALVQRDVGPLKAKEYGDGPSFYDLACQTLRSAGYEPPEEPASLLAGGASTEEDVKAEALDQEDTRLVDEHAGTIYRSPWEVYGDVTE